MNEIPVNAETTNKTLDLISDSTKQTRKEIDKTTAKGVNKLAQLFWASPIGIKADVYIAERPYKMEQELKKMQAKYDLIPAKYQTEPSSYIALKGVNELNYSLDEEHLKEMFENLLVSDMDSRKQNKVLPSYIEIIKQLSKEDARFLKLLKETNETTLPLVLVEYITPNLAGSVTIDKVIIISLNHTLTPSSIVLDNLERLNIIQIYDDREITSCQLYELGFDLIKHKYTVPPQSQLSYQKAIFKITDFGKNFIDICLS